MKKIFRMALVFALAGATLVYTGCTKDYAEEIEDLNQKIAQTDANLKTVQDAVASARALAETVQKDAATKNELKTQVDTLNNAIKAVDQKLPKINGRIDSLATEVTNLWTAIKGIRTSIDSLGNVTSDLETRLATAETNIEKALKLFNQIQSVVFVPEYLNTGIIFNGFKFGKENPDYTAIATFKVTPEKFAEKVGTTYVPTFNFQPLKTKSVEEPIATDKVYVIGYDAETGYVEVAVKLPAGLVNKRFAASLQLTEAKDSETNISSDFILVEETKPEIVAADSLKLVDKTNAVWSEKATEIRYDSKATYKYFEGYAPKFHFNQTWYKIEDFAKAFPNWNFTWADTVKVAKQADVFVVSDTTGANLPAKVKLADVDSLFEYVGKAAVATYYVTFTKKATPAKVLPAFPVGKHTAIIVESYSTDIVYTNPVKVAWNYQNFAGFTFEDNSLPVPFEGGIEFLTNDDKSDFYVDPASCFKGTISEKDFNAKKAKGVDTLLNAVTPDDRKFFSEGTLKYKDSKNVDFTLVKNGVWPKNDTTFYAVWDFEKYDMHHAFAIPITVTAKPADKIFAYADTIEKASTTYKLAAAFDSIYTEAFANKLVDGLSGQTAAKAAAKEALAALLDDPVVDSAKINKTDISSSFTATWDETPKNIGIKFNSVKYSDKIEATFHNTAFGVQFTFKVTLTTEKEPGYKFGFIAENPRLTSVDGKNAIAYAALTSEGIPENAYMNQFVRVVRPAGVTNAIFNRDALKVKFNVVKPAKVTDSLETASVATKANFAQTDEYGVQSSWSETADTTLAYIGAAESLALVEWNDCVADTIPVKAVLYCDEAPIDSVIVKVYTDDPFAGADVFKGYDFVFDASERNNADVTMGNLHIYDSVIVKSNLAVFANTNFVCPNFYQHHVAITGGTHSTYNCSVDGDGIVTGSCSTGLTHIGNPQNFYAQYNATTGAYKTGADNLNLELKIAPVSKWTYGNGSAVEDNPTNLKPEFAKGQITLLKGNKLTEDLVVTIPIELTYRYSQKPLTSQVTVTFTK